MHNSGVLGWWRDVCHSKNVLPSLGCHRMLIRGFFLPPSFLLRVDCACNRISFLATVFDGASAFNGDLNQWDVGNVTDMTSSKSIRIVENDLT